MNETLTLDYLTNLHNRFQTNFPRRKPIVGFIMNPSVLNSLKDEAAKDVMVVDERFNVSSDYLMGAPIWICNDIKVENSEIWYDVELLNYRLKQLKLL